MDAKLKEGTILLENPPLYRSTCLQNNEPVSWTTTWRTVQANLFSVVTKDKYQHALTVFSENKICHTRMGIVRIDYYNENEAVEANSVNFPTNFVNGCTILSPNIPEIEKSLSEIFKDKKGDEDDGKLYEWFWNERLKPCYMKAVERKCATDTLGIVFTPIYRSRYLSREIVSIPSNDKEYLDSLFYPDANQKIHLYFIDHKNMALQRD